MLAAGRNVICKTGESPTSWPKIETTGIAVVYCQRFRYSAAHSRKMLAAKLSVSNTRYPLNPGDSNRAEVTRVVVPFQSASTIRISPNTAPHIHSVVSQNGQSHISNRKTHWVNSHIVCRTKAQRTIYLVLICIYEISTLAIMPLSSCSRLWQ